VYKIGMTTIKRCLLGSLLLNMKGDSSVASASSQQLTQSHPAKDYKKRRAADMSWVKLHKQYPSAFLTNGPRHSKRVALPFDDAPDARYTPAILDILAEYKVCATFFVVGNRASKNPAIVKR